VNDQNRGDHPQIQPPPGWLGTNPAPEPAGEQPAPPGYPPEQPGYPPAPGVPGHPAQGAPGYQGYPAPGYGPPDQYGQPYPQPYGNQPYGSDQYGSQPYNTGQYGTGQYGTGQYGTGQYGSGPYGTVPPPPPRKRRRGLKTLLVLLLLGALGGGGYYAYRTGVLVPYLGTWAAAPTTPSAPAAPTEPDTAGASDDAGATDGGFGAPQPGLSTTVPGCPFTADQVTAMIGQPMVDKGTCLFGDGKGVAQLGIEVHSASSTSAALGYARQQASKQYLLVEDLKSGDKGYIAYKNTAAEAVAVTAQGGYTITMSGFERFNGFTYEDPLTSIISALPR
jgi:hypothetical protein